MDFGEVWIGVEAEFKKRLMANQNFRDALIVACIQSCGKIWLTGGSVFRLLANIMYRTPMPADTDFDFIVTMLEEKVCVPPGWRIEENHYKNPKLIRDALSVDLIPIEKVHSIVRRGVAPTIENYLTGTPLNIQSIAYDCMRREIIGEIGIGAIRRKTVAFNDPIQAEIQAARKNMTAVALLEKYAHELGFACGYPAGPLTSEELDIPDMDSDFL